MTNARSSPKISVPTDKLPAIIGSCNDTEKFQISFIQKKREFILVYDDDSNMMGNLVVFLMFQQLAMMMILISSFSIRF